MISLQAAQRALVQGMEIPPSLQARIKSLMPQILAREEKGIIIVAKANAFVFQLPDYPRWVFKLGKAEHRFRRLVEGKQVCLNEKLNHLVIPQAQKFDVEYEGETYSFVVEEKLDCDANEFYQEELYYKNRERLDSVIQQLALFIAKTHFGDVNFRNIPILSSSTESIQIGLFDLEDSEGPQIGLLGHKGFLGTKRMGLLGCTYTDQQMALLFAEAVKVTDVDEQACKEQRRKELAGDLALREFYQQKKIEGKEPLQVDYDSLDLSESKEFVVDDRIKRITLREAMEDMVKYINESIAISEHPTVKGKRWVNILTFQTHYKYSPKKHYGTPFSSQSEEKEWHQRSFIYEDTENDDEDSWLERIVDLLIKNKYIFQINMRHGNGISIQT